MLRRLVFVIKICAQKYSSDEVFYVLFSRELPQLFTFEETAVACEHDKKDVDSISSSLGSC
jgi:hypothetical protein